MITLSDILDQDLLLDLAGDRSFERGVDYFERGLVRSLAQYGERITADVRGAELYQVQLWLQDQELMSRCTCPLGVEGIFCKHCVAVGLAWIEEPPPYHLPEAAPAKTGTTMVDVQDYLARQDHETLVRMILDRLMEDTRWREELLMKAAAHQIGGANISTFRKALRRAIATDGLVDYYEAASYAEGVQSAIDGLENLLDSGYASDVVELSEEAIALLEESLNSVDDSDGHLNLIIDQVQTLHYRACEAARPDPGALAGRLFHQELQSEYGFFYNALESYTEILGDRGRDTYQQLVDAEWEKLPAIGQEERHSYNYRRLTLSRMKESLVAAAGNLEELVAVIAKDLSQPSRYLRIAQLYQEAGQLDTAIAWAEQGMTAFQANYFGQLGDFLIAAYEQQSRFEDAIALLWQVFEHAPSLVLYQRLKHQADKIRKWPEWREKALAHIRQVIQTAQSPSLHRGLARSRPGLLVEIFLWEEDVDQAWQAARSNGCSSRLWMKLADLRSVAHPEDALLVYQPAIEPLINQTSNDAYHQAVELLGKVKDVMTRLDRGADFATFIDHLTKTYKRKRNFIKLLGQKGLV